MSLPFLEQKGLGTVDDRKFCFIACVNDEHFFEECKLYLSRLVVPEGFSVEILAVTEAKSMASGYNEGMNASDAKYKIYLHQDTFITDRFFLYDLLQIFRSDRSIGMVGAVGTMKMPEDGVMWHNPRVGCLYHDLSQKIELCECRTEVERVVLVEAIDGFLMATQYDIPWREDLFCKFDFYDASQSMEFIKKGYKIAVPVMEKPLCVHDDGVIVEYRNYENNRRIFVREYGKMIAQR